MNNYIDDGLRNHVIKLLNIEGLPVNNSTIKMMADQITKPDPNKPNILEITEDEITEDVNRSIIETNRELDWRDPNLFTNYKTEDDKKITELLMKYSTYDEPYRNEVFSELMDKYLGKKLEYTCKTLMRSLKKFPNYEILPQRDWEDMYQEITLLIEDFALNYKDKSYDGKIKEFKFSTISVTAWYRKIVHCYYCNQITYLNALSRKDKTFEYIDDDNNFEQYEDERGEEGFKKILDDDEFNQILNKNKFNDNQKQVLKLLYKGYTVTDIAEITGRDKSLICRTKRQIKTKLIKNNK